MRAWVYRRAHCFELDFNRFKNYYWCVSNHGGFVLILFSRLHGGRD